MAAFSKDVMAKDVPFYPFPDCLRDLCTGRMRTYDACAYISFELLNEHQRNLITHIIIASHSTIAAFMASATRICFLTVANPLNKALADMAMYILMSIILVFLMLNMPA